MKLLPSTLLLTATFYPRSSIKQQVKLFKLEVSTQIKTQEVLYSIVQMLEEWRVLVLGTGKTFLCCIRGRESFFRVFWCYRKIYLDSDKKKPCLANIS